jgi:hypothetical protein
MKQKGKERVAPVTPIVSNNLDEENDADMPPINSKIILIKSIGVLIIKTIHWTRMMMKPLMATKK